MRFVRGAGCALDGVGRGMIRGRRSRRFDRLQLGTRNVKRLLITLLTALAACVGYVAPGSATILTYTFAASPSCCGTGPFGTVKLDDHGGSGSVDVTVHPFVGDGFVDTGAGGALLFNLAGDPALTA